MAHMEIVFYATLLSLLAFSNSEKRYRLIIAIYSPPGSSWEAALSQAFENEGKDEVMTVMLVNPTDSLEIEFVYLTEKIEFNLRSIGQTRELFLSESISAIIGEFDPTIQVVAEGEGIPYLVTSEHEPYGLKDPKYTFFMLPEKEDVNRAVLDVVDAFKWNDGAVIYDSPDGLNLVEAMMTMKKLTIRAWKLEFDNDDVVIRDHLLEIRQLDLRRIIVHCRPETVNSVLRVALRLSMLSDRYTWLVVHMDPMEITYEPYIFTEVNFTTFQLYGNEAANITLTSGLRHLDYAAAVDALRTLILATTSVIQTANGQCPPLCGRDHKLGGTQLQPYIKEVEMGGMTGKIQFDDMNYRTNLTLRIMLLTEDGIRKTGGWYHEYDTVKKRLMLDVYKKPEQHSYRNILGSEGPVRIVTIMDDPFVMRADDYEKKTGNARYQGYLIDLIGEIARQMNFEYELYDSPDGNYGSKNATTGQWNGMINELIMGNAAMCLGAISITSEREEMVDFTKPFKQKEFNLLMRKPQEKTSIIQFLWPLHTYVWVTTITAMILVGVLLFILDKVSPNTNESGHRFDFWESVWFIYASLVGVGTETVPRTLSGRLLSGAWWFFSLILVSSYTANLAAFLTVTKIDTPIKNIQDLAAQTTIKYGTVKNTYAMSMFRSAEMAIFRTMWEHMSKLHPDGMVDNSSAGLLKAKAENYAFIWDSPINKYTALHDCEVMALGEPFDEKGYGIGLPLGAAYRDQITMVILSLSESDFMMKLNDKWWGSGKCEEFKETSTQNKELQFHNVAGIFVVLAFGAGLGTCVAIFEYILKKARKRSKQKNKRTGDETDNSRIAMYPTMNTYPSTAENSHDNRKTVIHESAF